MEIFLFWVGFSILVAVAANARGRSGIGWFFLSLVISPLLALLFVLVMQRQDAPEPRPAYTTAGPFQAESVLSGIPYRTLSDGSIEAVMQGATVRFADYARFATSIGAPIPPPAPPPEQPLHRWTKT
ncbi:hypothetical protein ACE10X_22385 [Bradyrhizobium sp. Pha-3]|uniref:hypothetical protein n=1 Tax=Bradyrhizobium sp. Pha-3 TaxID=208375 RepID=UPI0035D49AC1